MLIRLSQEETITDEEIMDWGYQPDEVASIRSFLDAGHTRADLNHIKGMFPYKVKGPDELQVAIDEYLDNKGFNKSEVKVCQDWLKSGFLKIKDLASPYSDAMMVLKYLLDYPEILNIINDLDYPEQPRQNLEEIAYSMPT